ncbi:hypothetical protein EC991_011042 [Linnemannia zychae]|nr:hypothetical protein EC991_011042 [Linnemannia zychae]
MSYRATEKHYHPCELQHHLLTTITSVYESELPLVNADEYQEDSICVRPQPLAHTTDSDSDDSDTDFTASSPRKSKKYSEKKSYRSHSSSSSSARQSSFMVPEKVKQQGDLAIHDLLDRLHNRQGSFGMLSTTHYDRDGVYNVQDDEGSDNNGERGGEEGEVKVLVHHQGLAPELLRETLGPHTIRQHHGNANLRHD